MTDKNTSFLDGSSTTLGHLIHLLNQNKDRILSKHMTPCDITAQQFKVMLLLYRNPSMVCRDLSQKLSTDAGAITRILDRLEKKGLIRRSRDLHDRRRVTLTMTDKGIAVCHQFPDLAFAALDELTQGLTGEEVEQLQVLLTRLLNGLGALEP